MRRRKLKWQKHPEVRFTSYEKNANVTCTLRSLAYDSILCTDIQFLTVLMSIKTIQIARFNVLFSRDMSILLLWWLIWCIRSSDRRRNENEIRPKMNQWDEILFPFKMKNNFIWFDLNFSWVRRMGIKVSSGWRRCKVFILRTSSSSSPASSSLFSMRSFHYYWNFILIRFIFVDWRTANDSKCPLYPLACYRNENDLHQILSKMKFYIFYSWLKFGWIARMISVCLTIKS